MHLTRGHAKQGRGHVIRHLTRTNTTFMFERVELIYALRTLSVEKGLELYDDPTGSVPSGSR